MLQFWSPRKPVYPSISKSSRGINNIIYNNKITATRICTGTLIYPYQIYILL
jgi:hypothetical protein